MAEPLTPTQADRRLVVFIGGYDGIQRDAILRGDWDASYDVQQVALHASHARIAALEEAARVAEGCGGEGGKPIAKAIRATLSTPQEQGNVTDAE